MTRIRSAAAFLPVAALALLRSCSEQLPVRVEPTDVLSGSIRGEYLFNPTENLMMVSVTIRNDYEETLDGTALFDGTIRIVASGDTSIHKTQVMNASNVSFTRVKRWNPLTRQLTLDPGDTLTVIYKWNFIDDGGRNLILSYFRYWPHPDCPDFRLKADSATFELMAEIRLFEKTNLVTAGPTKFLICHVMGLFNIQGCPPIRADIPCFVLPKDTSSL